MPRFLWLATGGKSQINDRLLVLKGRKVVAFPDVDGYDEWLKKLAEYPELGVTVSPVLQQNATAADREAHIDIADWLLRYMFGPPPEEVDKWYCQAFPFLSTFPNCRTGASVPDSGRLRKKKRPAAAMNPGPPCTSSGNCSSGEFLHEITMP